MFIEERRGALSLHTCCVNCAVTYLCLCCTFQLNEHGVSACTHICQVEYAAEGGKRSSCMISVRMPEGDVVRVDEIDPSGATIDVDFREIS